MTVGLNVTIANRDPFWLQVTADLAQEWRRNDKGNGYFAAGSIPYHGDRSLEVTLNVRVRPYYQPTSFSEFPTDIRKEGFLLSQGAKAGGYTIEEGKCLLLISVGDFVTYLEQRVDRYLRFGQVLLLLSPVLLIFK